MKQFNKLLVIFFLFSALAGTSIAQTSGENKADSVVTFRFLPGDDMFYLKGNEAKLNSLYALIEKYRAEIEAATMPVYVDGYCASQPTAKENLITAYARANRVKSELILQKGLKEDNFVTGNYPRSYQNKKDVVVVTLRIPAAKEPTQPKQPEAEQPAREEPTVKDTPRQEPTVTEPTPAPAESIEPAASTAKPYCLAVRTNLLYDAFLLPSLGIEWRINESVGVKLDGSLSWWGTEHGRVQKIWLLNPEVRWYLLHDKRFYLGISGNYGECNIYEYPIGNLLRDDTGYQGKFWNAGITLGYQLPLSRHFALDFNLGLGYNHSDYDSFGIERGVRVIKGRDRSKSIWGPTQAGINFVWTIGGNKK